MRWIVLSCLLAAPVFAQTAPSPMEQAMGAKIMVEISTLLQCSSAQIILQTQLDAVRKELADLKAKEAKP